MPLNIRDEEQKTDLSEPQPILHAPSADQNIRKRLTLILFIVVVVGAAIFLVYMFALRGDRQLSAPETAVNQSVETLAGHATESTQQTSSPHTQTAKPPGTGNYTVYIASYPERTIAAEEVQRWSDAGYQAFVVDSDGRHRVALGEYSGYSKARQTAEQLQDGFEYGYWIGMLE